MPGRVQPPRARGLLLREVRPRVFAQWVTHSFFLAATIELELALAYSGKNNKKRGERQENKRK